MTFASNSDAGGGGGSPDGAPPPGRKDTGSMDGGTAAAALPASEEAADGGGCWAWIWGRGRDQFFGGAGIARDRLFVHELPSVEAMTHTPRTQERA